MLRVNAKEFNGKRSLGLIAARATEKNCTRSEEQDCNRCSPGDPLHRMRSRKAIWRSGDLAIWRSGAYNCS
jgi:hypothetical protein